MFNYSFITFTLITILFFCSLSSVIPVTQGWGTDVQRIISHAAYSLVSEEVQELIRNAVDAHELFYFAAQVEEYKDHDIGAWSKPLHTINVDSITNPDLDSFNLINAVKNYTGRLTKEIQKTGDMNKCPCFIPEDNLTQEPCSLAMLAHFVADLHQPMQIESSTRSSICSIKTYNTYRIGSDSESFSSNFCRLWRDDIPRQWSKNWENTWDQVVTFPRVNSAAKIEGMIGSMDPQDWARESQELWEQQWQWINDHRDEKDANGSLEIGWEYYTQHLDVLLQRITVASLRLSRLLERIAKKKNESVDRIRQHDEL
eukprot:gb/GECH01010425.1/.p1 GENE.gb/GECH01010425.1/~~gb/GECH01010425.1/.p1  ORF type:complete len:314 (+),score=57.37 gb/GECH01010425.1/:1-942(+)